MEWTSKELEEYYNVLNKVYGMTIKQKFPFVISVFIDPKDFLEKIKMWSIDVDVYMCIDWELQRSLNLEEGPTLGEQSVMILLSLQTMLEKPAEISGKKIYPKLEINRTKYCKGLLAITYD